MICDRFLVALACGRRVDRIGPVFHAGAERKCHLQSALRQHVEHGVFFGQAVWIFEVGRRAPHADLGVPDLRNDRRGDQVRRRHHAVRRIVMLVDDDGVEAEAVGKHELRNVLLVELMPAFGVVKFVREVDPERREVLVVFRQVNVRHEMHQVETDIAAHQSLPLAADAARTRNGRTPSVAIKSLNLGRRPVTPRPRRTSPLFGQAGYEVVSGCQAPARAFRASWDDRVDFQSAAAQNRLHAPPSCHEPRFWKDRRQPQDNTLPPC